MADLKPDFSLIVPAGRNTDKKIEMGLRELDEPTYLAAAKLIDNGKMLEAVKVIILNLRVSGAPAKELTDNFIALRAAVKPILELVEPLEGELKKN